MNLGKGLEDKIIFAVDPGCTDSAYCIMTDTYNILEFGKVTNDELKNIIYTFKKPYTLVIEKIASYNMRVGATVFDTCEWTGRFIEAFTHTHDNDFAYIYRREEKQALCKNIKGGSMKAKDKDIRQALIDRFGDVGTKGKKGYFYGFKSDIWSAFAVGITYLDKKDKEQE